MSSDKTKKKRKPKDEEFTVGSSLDKPRKKKKKVDGRSDRTPERAKRKLDRRRDRLNETMAELNLERIVSKVKPGEQDYLAEYVWMFERVGRLIRSTEVRALKSGQSRDVYALSTLISQQREIIADIRTLADSDNYSQTIIEMVLRPLVSVIGNMIIEMSYQMRTVLQKTTKPSETQFALKQLDDVMKELGRGMQMHYSEAAENTRKVISGELQPTGAVDTTKKKKKKTSKNAEPS